MTSIDLYPTHRDEDSDRDYIHVEPVPALIREGPETAFLRTSADGVCLTGSAC